MVEDAVERKEKKLMEKGKGKRIAREIGAKKWQQDWNNYKGVALSINIVRDETRTAGAPASSEPISLFPIGLPLSASQSPHPNFPPPISHTYGIRGFRPIDCGEGTEVPLG